METHPAARDFNLDNFRLPPGITLTRVEGTHAPAHPDLPMRMVSRSKADATNNTTNNSKLPGANSIIVTSPQPHIAPKPKESMGNLTILHFCTLKHYYKVHGQLMSGRVGWIMH